MKIERPGRVSSGTPVGRKGRVTGGDARFSLGETASAGAAAGTAAPQRLHSVQALLGLQEVGDAASGRSRGLGRGHDLLDRLEEVRLGILTGTIPHDRLERIALMLRENGESTGDAGLDGVLAEIGLRAEVELAKLGRFL